MSEWRWFAGENKSAGDDVVMIEGRLEPRLSVGAAILNVLFFGHIVERASSSPRSNHLKLLLCLRSSWMMLDLEPDPSGAGNCPKVRGPPAPTSSSASHALGWAPHSELAHCLGDLKVVSAIGQSPTRLCRIWPMAVWVICRGDQRKLNRVPP